MASFENEEAVKSVVIANTKFAFNLYKELVGSGGEDGNFVISPLALSTALAALYRGAHEQTAEQLKHAMKLDLFNLDDEAIHAAFAELVDFTLNKSPNCNFTMLNGLFTQEGFPLEEDFAESMSEQYQVNAQSVNFGDDAEASCTQIKQWAENSTASQIRDIINEVTADTLMVVINLALYKGQWQRKFDSKTKRDFQISAEESSKASFIGSTSDFNHVVLDELDAEAVAIPYVNHDVSLIVVLPNSSDGLASTEEAMTGDAIEDVINNMSKQRMRVEIPKFRLEYGLDVERMLRQLEITDLFTLGEADMSGVDGTEALYVSKFAHRTIIEVAEDGEPQGQSGGGEIAREFIANHPFLYFIRDNRSEAILLMGRYTKPPPKLIEDGITRVGMSVKMAFKRMSSKDSLGSGGAPGTPTSPKRQDSSSSQSSKKQAPPPPSPTKPPQPEAQTTSKTPQATASYGATEQKAEVNPPQSPTSPAKKKSKKNSSLFFCCVKSSADDLDFDTM